MSYEFHGMVVPDELLDSIHNYIFRGIPTGGFLQAVIDNDLAESCGRADDKNIRILPAIVAYFYNHAPTGSWGSKGAHNRWVKKKLEEREKNAEVK